MARMLLDPPNFLVLDEPTNHLDLATKEMLVSALKDFDGTMIFVSHDRTFLRGLSNRVLELGGEAGTDSQPHAYPGCTSSTSSGRATRRRASMPKGRALARGGSLRSPGRAPRPKAEAGPAAPKPEAKAGHECYHCKQWIEAGEAHDCWTTTETALTKGLSEDLREAWERLRETASELGEQRVYASHNSIMFARKSCYFFVRPKKTFLEVCVFLGRTVKSPRVRRADNASRTKVVHFIRVVHRDEVEPPLTDWLREAYELTDVLTAKAGTKGAGLKPEPRAGPKTARKTAAARKSGRG